MLLMFCSPLFEGNSSVLATMHADVSGTKLGLLYIRRCCLYMLVASAWCVLLTASHACIDIMSTMTKQPAQLNRYIHTHFAGTGTN